MTPSGEATALSAQAYLAVVVGVIDRVAASQREALGRAADLIIAGLRAGGIIHAFGTGHSEALAMEIAGRAGGLVPTNRIALRDLVLRGGEPASVLGPTLERDPCPAAARWVRSPPSPEPCSPNSLLWRWWLGWWRWGRARRSTCRPTSRMGTRTTRRWRPTTPDVSTAPGS